MSVSRLSIYQGTCQVLGERKVVSLTENVPARKELDGVWDRNGVRTCLQMGLWNFATRSVQADYSPSITPEYGHRRAFDKPTDFVRVVSVCSDEYFRTPLNDYEDEAGYWFADHDTIYVRYVSDDSEYGLDFARWPENFTRFVEHEFAYRICDRITGGGRQKDEIGRDRDHWLRLAKGTDAAEEPTRFLPAGTWSSARANGSYSGRHRIR